MLFLTLSPQFCCSGLCYNFRRNNVGYRKEHLCGMKRKVFRDFFGVLQSNNDNRDICLFRNFENTVVERQKRFFGFIASALRVYSNRKIRIFQQIRGAVDCVQRIFRILPVDWHKAAFSDYPPENRHMKILFFRNKSYVEFS